MVAKKKKKYSSGEGAQFMSRTSALKKLQLSLKDFRKLCILKGIYPREPRNRKRAQKGNTGIQTLYHKKDIQFLMQEPIIWKLRDYKIFCRKIGRAKAMRDFKKMKHYLDNHPNLKLDHIVKERYPSFIDALRDLDDCLTLCFLFSTFPSLPHIPRQQFDLCRRLTIEFLHYVIEAKALRKIFVSIKGYYYQAEIKGQLITWIVPHHFSFEPQAKSEVDFQVMSTFVEFYVIMLGFVNFRLYHSLNLFYPPTLNLIENEEDTKLVDGSALTSERISALNIPLKRSVSQMEDEEVELDQFPTDASTEEIEEAKIEYAKVKVLKTLFKGLKIFINREVPREPLVFIIRCFGGEVSWDKSLFVGSTFDESNETITHQIVDRQRMDKQYISRYYIQPQWIFDSINARELLPVEKYFIGKVLPPHLSPFVDKERDETQQYIPPEEKALNDPSLRDQITGDDENTDEEEKIETNEANDEAKNYEQTKEKITQKGKLSVKPGKVYTESSIDKARREKQEYRLREKMVKNKHRKLYKSMMEGRRTRNKEVKLIRRKRKQWDEKEKIQRKSAKN